MTDRLTPEERSRNMAQIKGSNTGPERAMRSLLHRAGFRFTVNAPNNRTLPGKPDIVLPKYRTVIFVHGCFWHRHANCREATMPKSNTDFWQAKFERNTERDRKNARALRRMGWHVLTVWTCELKRDPDRVLRRISRLLRCRSEK